VRLPFLQRFYRGVARNVAQRLSTDIGFIRRQRAAEASAAFIDEIAFSARALADADAVLDDAVAQALRIDGCLCEFGVYQGRTLRRIESLALDRQIHGFDSFEGLPEFWREGFAEGAFKTDIPQFDPARVTLHKGWFDATVAPFASTLRGPIALAHIDCDLYSSTKTVFDAIVPHLVIGSVILFDEYFNYPGWEHHEHRALDELIAAGSITVSYVGYNEQGEQLSVVVTGGDLVGTAINR
jgi:hypothetical protein